MVIACDCGVVVNPRGVETQLEGGMIYGLSAALFGEITVKNGRVEQGNFDTYPVVRFKDAPKTEVYISPTPGKRWGGVGEPGATMIQPAVTNAIFAATGKRLRTLPIRGQDLTGAAAYAHVTLQPAMAGAVPGHLHGTSRPARWLRVRSCRRRVTTGRPRPKPDRSDG